MLLMQPALLSQSRHVCTDHGRITTALPQYTSGHAEQVWKCVHLVSAQNSSAFGCIMHGDCHRVEVETLNPGLQC